MCFSACAKKANYNYVKTLKDFNINKLFIKDDFSENKLGSYYLGKGKSNTVEIATKNLIDVYIKKCHANVVVFCGSSKGGYAALKFSLFFKNSIVIIGAPQYYLGDYLRKSAMISQIDFILDEKNEEDFDDINNRLYERLKKMSGNLSKVYLNFSEKEHTYFEHIYYLIQDLNELKIDLETEIDSYSEHNDIAYYYPDYLKRTLTNILKE